MEEVQGEVQGEVPVEVQEEVQVVTAQVVTARVVTAQEAHTEIMAIVEQEEPLRQDKQLQSL